MKENIIRTLEGKYDNKRIHSWVLWKTLRDNFKNIKDNIKDIFKEETALTELKGKMSSLKELDDFSTS